MAIEVTADGRNLSKEEWRIIPEFPKYKITSDGDVKNRRTGHILTETDNGRGGYFYSLSKEMPSGAHKEFKRAFQGLVWDAFPELKPASKVKPEGPKRSYIKRGEWRQVPGYPNIEAHQDGAVRYATGRRRIKPLVDEAGTEYVVLRNKGARKWAIGKVLSVTFPELGIEDFTDVVQDSGWKDIPGLDAYEVSRDRQVRHKIFKVILKPRPPIHGAEVYLLHKKTAQKCHWSPNYIEDWAGFWADHELAA